jgi:hypothetical protein
MIGLRHPFQTGAAIESLGGQLMNGTLFLFDGNQIETSFERLIDGQIRKQRRDERRLSEQRTRKHQFQARKSCVADARSYRVARRLPVVAIAQFRGKPLNSNANTPETHHSLQFAARVTSRISRFVAALVRRFRIFRSA